MRIHGIDLTFGNPCIDALIESGKPIINVNLTTFSSPSSSKPASPAVLNLCSGRTIYLSIYVSNETEMDAALFTKIAREGTLTCF